MGIDRHSALIRGALILGLLAFGIWYLGGDSELVGTLMSVNTADLGIIMVVMVLFLLANAFTFKALLRLVDVRLPLSEAMALTSLTSLVNYLSPGKPGLVAKAAYLKRTKNLPVSRFSAVVVANALTVLLFSGLVSVLLLGYLHVSRGLFSPVLMGAAAGMCLAGWLPFHLPIPAVKRLRHFPRVSQWLEEAGRGFRYIRKRGRQLAWVYLTLLAQLIVLMFLFTACYKAIGVSTLDPATALLVGIFTAVLGFFTITPNNLGVQEAFIAFLFALSGLNAADGALAAVLIRAAHIASTSLLAPFFATVVLEGGIGDKA